METQLDIVSIDGSIYNLIAIDIGNSAIKLFGNSELLRFSYRSKWEIDLKIVLSGLSSRLCLFVVSSVNREKSEIFESMIACYPNFKIFKANDLISKQTIIDITNLQGIGNDRLLGLIGAKFYSNPPIMTIDCGTATTINLMDNLDVCRGGAILPGIFTQFRSLTENTSALKKIKLKHIDSYFGKNTNDAISSGILNGTTSVIKDFIHQAKMDISTDKLNIFITGGNAIWIIDNLLKYDKTIIHKPTLVLDGLKYLAKKFLQIT